jgi:hypothetical protein
LGLSTDLGCKILIPFDLSQAARGVALAAGIPNELAPIIKVSETGSVESVYNDPATGRQSTQSSVSRMTEATNPESKIHDWNHSDGPEGAAMGTKRIQSEKNEHE